MTKINLNLIAVVCLGVLLLDTAVNGGRITSDDVSRESPVQEVTDRTVRKGDLPSSEWKTLKRSKYLTYLFRKYGSGGLITFEVSAVVVVIIRLLMDDTKITTR